MTASNLSISRDLDNDVIYVINHKYDNIETENYEFKAGFIFNLHYQNNHPFIVGMIIEDFSKVFPDWNNKSDYELMEYFDNIMLFLNKGSILESQKL